MPAINPCCRNLNRGAVQVERPKQLRFIAGTQGAEKEQRTRLEKEWNLEFVVMCPEPHPSTSFVIAAEVIGKVQASF